MPESPEKLRVVLHTDGTELDDNETLQHFGGEILLLLTPDDHWYDPAAVPAAVSALPTFTPHPHMPYRVTDHNFNVPN